MRPFLDSAKISGGAVIVTTGVPGATHGKQCGHARDASNAVCVTTATPVPATAIKIQGLAFTPAGAMYVTNVVPGATSYNHQGFAIRNDGALHVTNGTPGTVSVGGFSISNYRVFVSGL